MMAIEEVRSEFEDKNTWEIKEKMEKQEEVMQKKKQWVGYNSAKFRDSSLQSIIWYVKMNKTETKSIWDINV